MHTFYCCRSQHTDSRTAAVAITGFVHVRDDYFVTPSKCPFITHRHKMSKSLKQHLRSIDKPVTIVLRGMRNIPHPLLTLTGRQGIMVKVSTIQGYIHLLVVYESHTL